LIAPETETNPVAPTSGEAGAVNTDGRPEWLPLAALGGLAGFAFGGWWLWRGRRRQKGMEAPALLNAATHEESDKPAARASSLSAKTPKAVDHSDTNAINDARASIAAPKAVNKAPIGRRADINQTFETLNAQSTLINFRLRYAITLHNAGDAVASPVHVRVGLFAGHQAHPQGIAGWYEQPLEDGHHRIETIAAGETVRFEGELAAPLEVLNPLVIDSRTMTIPLVAVDTRYHHRAGEATLDGQTARAYVVGRETGIAGAKLAPFRLDQGPTSFHPLGQRDTGISKTE
jgi:hypothetical protein